MNGARHTRCALTADRCQITSRLANPVQVETLTPQQARWVCTADKLSALASDPQSCAGLYIVPAWRWYLVCAGGRPGAVILSNVAQIALYPLLSV